MSIENYNDVMFPFPCCISAKFQVCIRAIISLCWMDLSVRIPDRKTEFSGESRYVAGRGPAGKGFRDVSVQTQATNITFIIALAINSRVPFLDREQLPFLDPHRNDSRVYLIDPHNFLQNLDISFSTSEINQCTSDINLIFTDRFLLRE